MLAKECHHPDCICLLQEEISDQSKDFQQCRNFLATQSNYLVRYKATNFILFFLYQLSITSNSELKKDEQLVL